MLARIDFEGNKYGLCEARNGDIFWVHLAGRKTNLVVPSNLSFHLSNEAVRQGTNPKYFSKKKPEAVKTIRARGQNSVKKSRFSISLSSLFKSSVEEQPITTESGE